MIKLKKDAENTFKALCELEEEPQVIENLEDIFVKVENDFNMWNGYVEIKNYTKLYKPGATFDTFADGLEPEFDFLNY